MPTRSSTRTCFAASGMCLCGMLAAEYQTLPKPMRDAVIRFFDENEAWLEKVLEQGRERERSSSRDRRRTRPG